MAGALEGDIFIGPKAEVIPHLTEAASSLQRTCLSTTVNLAVRKGVILLPRADSDLKEDTSGTPHGGAGTSVENGTVTLSLCPDTVLQSLD